MCRFQMLVSLCLVRVTVATDEQHEPSHHAAQRGKYSLHDKTQAVHREERGAHFPQFARRLELIQSESLESVALVNNGRMKIWADMRDCYDRCGDDHGCYHQCSRQWKVMKSPHEGALAEPHGLLQLWADDCVCRDKCGDDRICHEECMKSCDLMDLKCDEFENVMACHEACDDDFRCHEKCPTLHRVAHRGQGAADCHARCVATSAGRECYSLCSKLTVNFQHKCVALAVARACHGNCRREDNECQKSCWHETHGERGGDEDDYYHFDDADTQHCYAHHHNDQQRHFVDDETDMSSHDSHGHHRGFSAFWRHMKKRIADGAHSTGGLWHFATTKARRGIERIWHNVSQKTATENEVYV